jgi:multiple antibiotic resistance protein
MRKEAQVGGVTPAERQEEAFYTAVVPLAVPLSAGPGAISATILTASGAEDGWVLLGLLGIIVVLAASCFFAFVAASRIERWLGETGRNVLTRLLGILLAALAVQFVAAGLEGPFTPGVPPAVVATE